MPPCRWEISHLVALLKKYEARGLRIVGINGDEAGTPEPIRRTINTSKAGNGMACPCVLDDGTTAAKIPGSGSYPTTPFLDRAGRVRLVLVGSQVPSRLEAAVATLLAEPSPPPRSARGGGAGRMSD